MNNKSPYSAIKTLLLVATLSSSWAHALTYSTNFMWINRSMNNTEKYIFPEIRKKSSWDVNVVEWMGHWLKANPKGEFIFWYDKDFVSQEQIKNTEALLSDLTKTHLTGGTIKLKEVTSSPRVKRDREALSSRTPFYLRVDLLRVALGLDYLDSCRGECAYVYADVDKGLLPNTLAPIDLSPEAMFDEETMDSLKSYGLVMRNGPENSFLIISSHKSSMLKALDETVLQASYKRIEKMFVEEKALRQSFNTNALKTAPLDKNFDNVDGFRELSPEQVLRARTLAKRYVNEVFAMMTSGPLLVSFFYFEGEIEILANIKSQHSLTDLMSEVAVDMNATFATLGKNYRLIRFFSDEPTETESIEMARYITSMFKIPVKLIQGSRSQSYTISW